MARERGKGLKGFESVAKMETDVNSNINNEIKNQVNLNNNVKFNKIDDPLESLQEELPAKELTTVLKGVYFDNDVSDIIDEQAKKLGRGGKSRLVNQIVKNYFIQKGLL